MKHSTFIWFFSPTALAMILFIAFPIVSVLVQSVHAPHKAVLVEVETCTPLVGCTIETSIDQEATRELREEKPIGRFIGLEIFSDRGHLAISEVKRVGLAPQISTNFLTKLGNLPFYRAMAFTLTFTFIVTPLVVIVGFLVALNVNALHERIKGVVVFFSLLPFVITPLIGALVLFWMIDSRGVLGSAIQWIFADPNLSLKASTGLMWISLISLWSMARCPICICYFLCGFANFAG